MHLEFIVQRLVSILIPAHNAASWISQAIESALAQTWPNKEVIVVDDGSTDGTRAVARAYEGRRIKVFTQTNAGASAARNHAFSVSQGEIIQWLDADDLLAPDKVGLQMRCSGIQEDRRVLVSSAWGRFFGSPERARFIPDALWEDLTPAEWLFRKLDQNLWMTPNAWLMSRELADAAGPWNPELRRDNDGEYFCRVIRAASRIQFVSDARSYVRKGNSNSISHNRSLSHAKLESLLRSLCLHVRYMRELEDSERSRVACARLLQRWLIYFYPEHPEFVEKMRRLAREVGGELSSPRLRWKYRWIQRVFGWKAAKAVLFRGPKLQEFLARARESLTKPVSLD